MMGDYVKGGVANILGNNSTKKVSGDCKNPPSSTNDLFSSSTNQSTNIEQQLKVQLQKLNKLAEKVKTESSGKRKQKQKEIVFKREAALRQADVVDTPKKKRKKNKEEVNDKPEKDLQKEDGVSQESEDNKTTSKREKRDRSQQREHRKLKKQNVEKDSRTVFVGNLSTSTSKKTLLRLFKDCGKIESIRFRSAAPADLKLSKKLAVIRKAFHEKRHNINAYIVFTEKKAVFDALTKNGTLLDDLHIRVDKVQSKDKKQKHDYKHSLFIGNLPFDVEEDSIRNHFEDCGIIEGVRIIRDRKTGLGKGFGYILFQDMGSVQLALQLNGKEFLGRSLRIQHATPNVAKAKEKNETEQKGGKTIMKRKLPTNVSKSSYQGLKAQKMKKIKKKLKHKKLHKKMKGINVDDAKHAQSKDKKNSGHLNKKRESFKKKAKTANFSKKKKLKPGN